MKTRFYIAYLTLFFAFTFLSCSTYQNARIIAFEEVQNMNENILLVRLNAYQGKLQKLKESGETEKYKELSYKVKYSNDATMKAFASEFDFCDTYFFYSDDAKALKDENYAKVRLFDSQSNEVKSKILKHKDYWVAAFHYSYSDVSVQKGDDNKLYATSGTNPKNALVIMDSDYIQLADPFPYRVIHTSGDKFKSRTVRQLNSNLYDFFYLSKRKLPVLRSSNEERQ